MFFGESLGLVWNPSGKNLDAQVEKIRVDVTSFKDFLGVIPDTQKHSKMLGGRVFTAPSSPRSLQQTPLGGSHLLAKVSLPLVTSHPHLVNQEGKPQQPRQWSCVTTPLAAVVWTRRAIKGWSIKVKVMVLLERMEMGGEGQEGVLQI